MCYSGGSHPATATKARSMVMIVFLFINYFFILYLLSILFRTFVAEII